MRVDIDMDQYSPAHRLVQDFAEDHGMRMPEAWAIVVQNGIAGYGDGTGLPALSTDDRSGSSGGATGPNPLEQTPNGEDTEQS